MWTTALVITLLFAGVFFAGAQFAKNRIMHNMMADLVEAKDMLKWLKVWS